MPTWPGTLPVLGNPNPEGSFGDTHLLQTTMDSGITKQRSKVTTPVEPLRQQMYLDATQFATFRTFYKTTLANGVLEFDGYTDPFLGTTHTYILKKHSFTQPSKGVFLLSLELEKQP